MEVKFDPEKGASMDRGLENTLFAEGRRLYRNRLPWGFECADGWFLLLVDLTRSLETICARQEATPGRPSCSLPR